jgi:hypothetical protein
MFSSFRMKPKGNHLTPKIDSDVQTVESRKIDF